MAKSAIPGLKTSGGVGKLIGVVVLIALVTAVVRYPHESADAALWLVNAAGDVINGVVAFFRGLAH